MKLAIQDNILQDDKVLGAIKNLPHQLIGIVPFSHELTSNEEIIGKNYIPYGSTAFIKKAIELDWNVSFNKNFRYLSWIVNREDMLNGYVLNIKEFLARKDEFYSNKYFIRPDGDLKKFLSGIKTKNEWINFFISNLKNASSQGEKLEELDRIVIGYPTEIQSEYRCFIIDGKVISVSQYRNNGQLFFKSIKDLSLYQDLADVWLPHTNCVMDVALLPNGSYRIIEFNCINTSGFYDNNIKLIFESLLKNYE